MKNRILSLSLFVLIYTSFCYAEEFANIPKMVVKGEASVFKPADQMEISLGVVTLGENSSKAINENNERIKQIISNLQAIGLDDSDYQTGQFHIHPIYRKTTKSGEEDRTTITHYEVINAIQIKTQKINLAEKIVDAATQGGANQLDQLNFNLNNPQSYREEAIALAAQNALMDAHALANAAGVHIVRILNLSLDHWHQFPKPYMLAKGIHMNALESSGGVTLEAGKTEIHASVSIMLEIDSDKQIPKDLQEIRKY